MLNAKRMVKCTQNCQQTEISNFCIFFTNKKIKWQVRRREKPTSHRPPVRTFSQHSPKHALQFLNNVMQLVVHFDIASYFSVILRIHYTWRRKHYDTKKDSPSSSLRASSLNA